MTRSLAATLAPGVRRPLAADEKTWVGQEVMPRKQKVTFGERGPDDKQVEFEMKSVKYNVLREPGGGCGSRVDRRRGGG